MSTPGGRTRVPTVPGAATWAAARRPVLASTASIDLVFRSIADLSLPEGVGALIALIGLSVSEARFVGIVATWLMYFALVVDLTPRIYPDVLKPVSENTSFRLLVASVAIVVFVLVSLNQSPEQIADSLPPITRFVLLLCFILVIPLGILAFVSYLAVITNRTDEVLGSKTPTQPPALIVAVLDEVNPLRRIVDSNVAEDRSEVDRAWATVTVGLFLLAFLAGFAIVILSGFYPAPELLVLSSVVVGVVADHRGPESATNRIKEQFDSRVLDLEQRFLEALAQATRGDKGLGSLGLAFIGSLFSMMLFVQAGRLWGNTHPSVVIQTTAPVLFAVSGMFGLWFWLRVVGRIPVSLDLWERTHRRADTPRDSVSDTTDRPLPMRASQLSLPPDAFIGGGLLAVVATAGWSGSLTVEAYLGGAVLGIAIVSWSLYRTVTQLPQPPSTDRWMIPTVWTVQYVVIGVVGVEFWLEGRPLVPLLLLTPMGWSVFFSPDIREYAAVATGGRAYTEVAMKLVESWYWFAVLALSALVSQWWLLHLGTFFLGFITVQSAKRAYEEADPDAVG